MQGEELRESLWEAVASKDDAHLAELCTEYREAIFQAYPEWRQAQGTDPKAYGQALAAVAKCFQSTLKDGRLFQLLLGVVDTNPLAAWENELQTAGELLGKHDLYESERELEGMLERNASHRGPRADALRARTQSLLGQVQFETGQLEKARASFLAAQDRERLFELERYWGNAEEARRWDATRDPHLGPPVRLLATVQGQEYELDEVPVALRPQASFLFRRNRPTLRLAQFYVDSGRKLAGLNYPQRALECYQKAAEIDRFDPECRSLAAFLLLQLGRYPEAVQLYEEAERLGPGYYRLSSEAWAARELAAGRLMPPAWQALVHMENGTSPPEEVILFARPVLQHLPRLAPLQFWYAQALERTGQPATEAYRQAIQHAGEPNLKTRALLALSHLVEEPERTDLLRQAVALEGHLPAAAQARWALER